MTSKTRWIVAIIILFPLSFLSLPITEAQNDETIVLEIINLHLLKNETYSRPVTLVPYAPHDLAYQVSQVNTTIEKALVIIELSSDMGSTGLSVYHDTLTRNRSYTPQTSDFQLSIINMGYIEIHINFTITQTGAPITAFYSPEDVMSEVIIPSVIIVVIPLIIAIFSIILYRRLKLNEIIEGKANVNAKIVVYSMMALAFLSPQYSFISSNAYDSLEFEISGGFWRFYSNVTPPIMFGFLGDPITTFSSLIFCYVIYRCYQAKSTRKSAVIVGLLSLIWQITPATLSLIFYPTDPLSPFIFFFVPIPFLFVIGLTLLFLLSPPEPPKAWDEGVKHTNEE
jgi:hypothetical protein